MVLWPSCGAPYRNDTGSVLPSDLVANNRLTSNLQAPFADFSPLSGESGAYPTSSSSSGVPAKAGSSSAAEGAPACYGVASMAWSSGYLCPVTPSARGIDGRGSATPSARRVDRRSWRSGGRGVSERGRHRRDVNGRWVVPPAMSSSRVRLVGGDVYGSDDGGAP